MKKLRLFSLLLVLFFLGYFLFARSKEQTSLTQKNFQTDDALKAKIEALEKRITLKKTEKQKLTDSVAQFLTLSKNAKEEKVIFLSEHQKLAEEEAKIIAQIKRETEEIATQKEKNTPLHSQNNSTEKSSVRQKFKPEEIEIFKKSLIPHFSLQIESLSLSQKETIHYWNNELGLKINKIHLKRLENLIIKEQAFSLFPDLNSEEMQEMDELFEIYNQNMLEVLTPKQKQEVAQLIEQNLDSMLEIIPSQEEIEAQEK